MQSSSEHSLKQCAWVSSIYGIKRHEHQAIHHLLQNLSQLFHTAYGFFLLGHQRVWLWMVFPRTWRCWARKRQLLATSVQYSPSREGLPNILHCGFQEDNIRHPVKWKMQFRKLKHYSCISDLLLHKHAPTQNKNQSSHYQIIKMYHKHSAMWLWSEYGRFLTESSSCNHFNETGSPGSSLSPEWLPDFSITL